MTPTPTGPPTPAELKALRKAGCNGRWHGVEKAWLHFSSTPCPVHDEVIR